MFVLIFSFFFIRSILLARSGPWAAMCIEIEKKKKKQEENKNAMIIGRHFLFLIYWPREILFPPVKNLKKKKNWSPRFWSRLTGHQSNADDRWKFEQGGYCRAKKNRCFMTLMSARKWNQKGLDRIILCTYWIDYGFYVLSHMQQAIGHIHLQLSYMRMSFPYD